MKARDRAERATCAHCATTQAVKKDGTVFKHTIYFAFEHVECPGSGQKPQ